MTSSISIDKEIMKLGIDLSRFLLQDEAYLCTEINCNTGAYMVRLIKLDPFNGIDQQIDVHFNVSDGTIKHIVLLAEHTRVDSDGGIDSPNPIQSGIESLKENMKYMGFVMESWPFIEKEEEK